MEGLQVFDPVVFLDFVQRLVRELLEVFCVHVLKFL